MFKVPIELLVMNYLIVSSIISLGFVIILTANYLVTVLIGYYPPTREVSYLLLSPSGASSKYDTSLVGG